MSICDSDQSLAMEGKTSDGSIERVGCKRIHPDEN